MVKTVEAIADEQGGVHLLEEIHPPNSRRALVTILDEGPTEHRYETALLGEDTLAADWTRPEEDAAWSHLQQGRLVAAPEDRARDFVRLLRQDGVSAAVVGEVLEGVRVTA